MITFQHFCMDNDRDVYTLLRSDIPANFATILSVCING